MHLGVPACAALLLCVAGVAGWGMVASQRAALARAALTVQLVPVAPAAVLLPVMVPQNLQQFYDTMGEPRHVDEQLRTLFALAAKIGLQLRQGEYKTGYNQVSQLATYQVSLPLKGPYQSIWTFSLLALQTIPFAALDEISFKRDAIADDEPEARLTLTLFLLPTKTGAQP